MRAIFLISCLCLASFSVRAVCAAPPSAEEKKHQFEVGIAGGIPVLVGVTGAFWGGPSLPLMARVIFGVGVQGDIGYQFSPGEDLNPYVALSGGAVGFLGILSGTYGFVGPSVGLRYKGLWIQGGPDYFSVSGSSSFLRTSGSGIFLHVNAGYGLAF